MDTQRSPPIKIGHEFQPQFHLLGNFTAASVTYGCNVCSLHLKEKNSHSHQKTPPRSTCRVFGSWRGSYSLRCPAKSPNPPGATGRVTNRRFRYGSFISHTLEKTFEENENEEKLIYVFLNINSTLLKHTHSHKNIKVPSKVQQETLQVLLINDSATPESGEACGSIQTANLQHLQHLTQWIRKG